MIHVDRSAVQPPDEWRARAESETKRVIEYFSRKQSQSRFAFRARIWIEVKPLLMQLFRNKCAFCETYMPESLGASVEHFRPKGEVQQIIEKRVVSRRPGYYWLAYRWENLYLACHACSQNKRNNFPIEGPRAEAPGDNVEERPLLLDPCVDDPEKHLQFKADGTVLSLDPKGTATIQVLGLNRSSLVEARADEAKRVLHELSLLRGLPGVLIRPEMDRLTDIAKPYAGMRRQLLAKIFSDGTVPDPESSTIKETTAGFLQPELDALRQIEESTTTIVPQIVPSIRTGYIKSIDIHNFKAIKDLKLNFPESREQASWKMLLGENAAGKSTVLKAVALALMGEEYTKAVSKRDKLLNSNAKSGYVRVQLFTDSDPIEFSFTKKTLTFKSGSEGGNLFLRAYGATRLLPREILPEAGDKLDQKIHEQLKKVDNLFDPFVTLCDAEKWLSGLDEDAFNSAGLTLKDLVHLDVEEALSKKDGEVRLDIGDGPLPLEQQSAGYQAVLAIATDIMAGIRDIYDKQQASGIVLLDEIDAHLHPRWKMEIVYSLREAFKNIQFLATTHEPLCLRGLEANEIALMKREGGQITVKDNLPSPAGLRVDQLLTSDLFGLKSTIDPGVEKKFNEYYALLAKRTLTDTELTRRDDLKIELEPYGVLGYTRRDQLIYEVIDQYLAKDLITTNSNTRAKMREETKKKVAAIWRRINAQRGVN